jgi:hypothetical protein
MQPHDWLSMEEPQAAADTLRTVFEGAGKRLKICVSAWYEIPGRVPTAVQSPYIGVPPRSMRKHQKTTRWADFNDAPAHKIGEPSEFQILFSTMAATRPRLPSVVCR